MTHDKAKTHLHFIGIGGIGMSGIAEVFLNQGYPVSGSDVSESEITRRLSDQGAKIKIGHRAEHVDGAQVVVVSSAVRSNNPEILEAKRLRIPVIRRAEMLGELMRGKVGIAVAGTHGKTTTTSMLATVLSDAGMDPTLVIGGKVDSLGGNAKLGQGQFVVAEADESDGSFLHLPATYGVITNVDNDHMEHYGSLSVLEDAFIEFVAKQPFYGLSLVCAEDPGVARILSRFTKPISTYGFSEDCDFQALEIKTLGLGTQFKVVSKIQGVLGEINLNVPGVHNVLNALAVVGLSLKLGLSFSKIQKGLRAFKGVKRRFEIRHENREKNILVVDDYGHHPTEIKATLAAAKSYWTGRIVTVFQPHRYSRTQQCRDGFLNCFNDTDVLIMTDIYSAGEDPIDGVDAETLIRDLKKLARPGQEILYAAGLEEAQATLASHLKNGDLILCMGAGSITKLPEKLVTLIG